MEVRFDKRLLMVRLCGSQRYTNRLVRVLQVPGRHQAPLDMRDAFKLQSCKAVQTIKNQ